MQAGSKRPLAVIIVSCLLAATGAVGLVHNLAGFKPQQPFQFDIVWVCLVSLIAVVGGVFMLRGSNWARWLAMAWIGFHEVLSMFHSWRQTAVHGLIFALFAYFLFRPESATFFQQGVIESPDQRR